MSARSYTVACLSGGGIGPELMAQASRTLQAVAGMFDFTVEELHVPFGEEARASRGHPLPEQTRSAYRNATAVLTATGRAPALEGVRSELELVAELRRAGFAPDGDIAMLNPLSSDYDEWTIVRAFRLADSRRGRIASTGGDRNWRTKIELVASDWPEIEVEHLTSEATVLVLVADPRHFDVIVTNRARADELARRAEDMTVVAATAELAVRGPSLFGPTHRAARRIAGQGVASPSGLLVAVALMLAEGLGERPAALALENAIREALRKGARTADMVKAGVAATTHEFTETVLAELPHVQRDDDLSTEALR